MVIDAYHVIESIEVRYKIAIFVFVPVVHHCSNTGIGSQPMSSFSYSVSKYGSVYSPCIILQFWVAYTHAFSCGFHDVDTRYG